MSNIIQFPYNGSDVRFDFDGWINATDVAKQFGKRPIDWLKQDETKEYLEALAEALGQSKVTQDHFGLVRTSRGGKTPGTWLHPKLGVRFAQWLDVRFAVWCDMHIDAILRGDIDPQRQYDRALSDLTNQNKRGSLAGSELARHRWKKPALVAEVEHWREQLQLPLGLQ